MKETITRREAISLGLSWYFTGKPCKHGHYSERRTRSGACIICVQIWATNNPDKINNARIIYHQRDQDKIKLRQKLWHRHRKIVNKNFRIAVLLRTRMSLAVRHKWKEGSAVRDLGCSIEYLRTYLETKFTDGMSWNNYGSKGWHIDHIQALSNFDLSDRQQFLKAAHYTNLQPLWWKDNLQKGAT